MCVTAAKLDQPPGCIRSWVPLLVPSAPRACASDGKQERRGKGSTRATMDGQGDAGTRAARAHRMEDVVFDEGAFELSFPPGVVPVPALSSPASPASSASPAFACASLRLSQSFCVIWRALLVALGFIVSLL